MIKNLKRYRFDMQYFSYKTIELNVIQRQPTDTLIRLLPAMSPASARLMQQVLDARADYPKYLSHASNWLQDYTWQGLQDAEANLKKVGNTNFLALVRMEFNRRLMRGLAA